MRVPEQFRVRAGRGASDERFGNYGAFIVPLRTNKQTVFVIASDGAGWEHVSVSRKDRCPTWGEMCEVKDLFFGPDEWVLQFHPAAADYVNAHPYCLDLWRPVGVDFPKPDAWLVGPKGKVSRADIERLAEIEGY
jgi:hypothetical protein